MFGASWKTTVIGLLLGAAAGIAVQFPSGPIHDYAGYAVAFFSAALGFVAKDKNVTGGAVPNS